MACKSRQVFVPRGTDASFQANVLFIQIPPSERPCPPRVCESRLLSLPRHQSEHWPFYRWMFTSTLDNPRQEERCMNFYCSSLMHTPVWSSFVAVFRIGPAARVYPATVSLPRQSQGSAPALAARRPSSFSCVSSVPAAWLEPWPRHLLSSSWSGTKPSVLCVRAWEATYGLVKTCWHSSVCPPQDCEPWA